MTQTTMSPPPPPIVSPRLERPPDSAFRGVCAALARTTGTSPALWRVLAVVLTFFGGLGVVLYLAGIVAIPEQGQERSLGDRLLHGPDRRLHGGQLLVVVLLAVGVVGLAADRDGLVALVVIGGLVVLWLRGRGDRPAGPPALASDAVSSSPPPIPRPRSPLTGVTASLAALVAGLLLLLGVAGRTSVPAEVVLAGALAVVGLGLVVGARWGTSGWLVASAALLSLALAVTVAVRPAVDAGLGDRTWTPGGSGSYRLGVGEATLDLRSLPVREGLTSAVDARVDVGHLVVLVPDGVRVSLDARAQLGDLLLLGVDTNGRHVSRHLDIGPEGRPQVQLDLSAGAGQVEVRRG